MTTATTTHERYLHAVRDEIVRLAVAAGEIDAETAERARHAKLLYGIGDGSYRGICYSEAWQNGVGKVDLVEIAASGQESWTQLAGTLLHELAHVLAGTAAGHDNEWKDTAVSLGFVKRPLAAGQHYPLALFRPALRHAIDRLAHEIADGNPALTQFFGYRGFGGLSVTLRPCSMGRGTRGGKSSGKGSGSRLRLWQCKCERPVKVRVASNDFQAHCDLCGEPFEMAS